MRAEYYAASGVTLEQRGGQKNENVVPGFLGTSGSPDREHLGTLSGQPHVLFIIQEVINLAQLVCERPAATLNGNCPAHHRQGGFDGAAWDGPVQKLA